MYIEERHQKILEILNDKLSIRAREITELFDVGFDTARRDLRILEEKGLLKRTHGGAIPVFQVGFKAPKSYTPKDIKHVKPNYMAIALEAVKMIKPNDVVYISGASVGYFMCQNLPVDIEFTAVVNSIILAELLRHYENITTVVLGGVMTTKGHLRHHFTEEMIRSLRFDVAFITAAAFSVEFGMSIQSSDGVSLLKSIVKSSKSCVGLFPHEKMGRESIMQCCAPADIEVLITDCETCESDVASIREIGIKVIVVDERL